MEISHCVSVKFQNNYFSRSCYLWKIISFTKMIHSNPTVTKT